MNKFINKTLIIALIVSNPTASVSWAEEPAAPEVVAGQTETPEKTPEVTPEPAPAPAIEAQPDPAAEEREKARKLAIEEVKAKQAEEDKIAAEAAKLETEAAAEDSDDEEDEADSKEKTKDLMKRLRAKKVLRHHNSATNLADALEAVDGQSNIAELAEIVSQFVKVIEATARNKTDPDKLPQLVAARLKDLTERAEKLLGEVEDDKDLSAKAKTQVTEARAKVKEIRERDILKDVKRPEHRKFGGTEKASD